MFFLFGSEHALVDFIRDLFFQDTVCSFLLQGSLLLQLNPLMSGSHSVRSVFVQITSCIRVLEGSSIRVSCILCRLTVVSSFVLS